MDVVILLDPVLRLPQSRMDPVLRQPQSFLDPVLRLPQSCMDPVLPSILLDPMLRLPKSRWMEVAMGLTLLESNKWQFPTMDKRRNVSFKQCRLW